MTALHFTSVSYIPTIIRIFNCWFKFICSFPSANYDHIRGNFEGSKSCWIIMGSQSSDVPAISHTDPALVITGSSNLCLMIVKLQRSLPWAKPSVHIWLTMVWFHFIKKLVESAKRSPYFSFSFDESLNSAFQEEQMDCVIRFWNDSECQVKTRYLNSKVSKPTKHLLVLVSLTISSVRWLLAIQSIRMIMSKLSV